MTPTDQTPDAVRAAIAEEIADSDIAWSSEFGSPSMVAGAVYDRLAQIGAFPAAGDDEFADFDIWDHANYRTLRTCGVSHDDAMDLARAWIATKRQAAARAGDGAT